MTTIIQPKNSKEEAILLRMQGKSYTEILAKIPVAKSTLSLWLRAVGLSKRQVQFMSEKKKAGQLRGALAQKTKRINLQQKIHRAAEAEIGNLSKRELWLIGIALYWAEGSKEKEYRPGSGLRFSNSDPNMINVFIKWLLYCCEINKDRINFSIYIHENHRNHLTRIQKHWSDITGFSRKKFDKIYFKKHNIKTKRKNVGDLYNGLLRVKVYASSELNRKVTGWTMGICKI